MTSKVVDYQTLRITRRRLLQAAGLAIAAGLTAIADELARLFRICSRNTALVGA